MANYMIDEKKNLVEYQESANEGITLIKKNHPFTFTANTSNDFAGIINISMEDFKTDMLSGKVLLMNFKIDQHQFFNNYTSPCSFSVLPSGETDMWFNANFVIQMHYLSGSFHCMLYRNENSNMYIGYERTPEIEGVTVDYDSLNSNLATLLAGITGSIELYLRS